MCARACHMCVCVYMFTSVCAHVLTSLLYLDGSRHSLVVVCVISHTAVSPVVKGCQRVNELDFTGNSVKIDPHADLYVNKDVVLFPLPLIPVEETQGN
jgi:hypothetical protein